MDTHYIIFRMYYKGDLRLIPFKGEERNISPRIIVQGGAYSLMLADLTEVYKKTTKESAKKGYAILTVSAFVNE